MSRQEYIVIAVLLILGGLAFPAFRDVHLIERIAISICSAAGLL